MDVFVRLVLLALLALSSSATPGTPLTKKACNLTELCGLTMVTEDDMLEVIKSPWVLVEGYANNDDGVALLTNASSSVTKMKLYSDHKTYQFIEINNMTGKCLTYYTNMSAPDPGTSNHTLHMLGPAIQDLDGQPSSVDDHTKVDIYQPCDHSLIIIYYTDVNTLILKYRKNREDQDQECEDQCSVREASERWKFNVDKYFKYDGKAGFCEEKEGESEG